MKKLLSFLLSVLMVLIMTSVGVFAESADGITLRVETKTAQVGINHEDALIVTVYGTWKNYDSMDIFTEYETENLEFVSAVIAPDVLAALCELKEDGKIQYSAIFNSKSSNGERKLFECSFKAKKNCETQLVFSATEPVVISGQNEFTVNTYGLDFYDENEMFYFSVSDGKIKLRNIYSAAIDENGLLDIPTETDGIPVSSIGNNFVTYNDDVKSVVIPASVTDIGAYSFFNCCNLKDVYIFSDSAEIDDCAIGWYSGNLFDKGITIHGAKGSAAEKYAEDNGMYFHECSAFHEAEKYRIGDVNNDGNVNAADARLVLRTAAKLETMTATQFSAADVMRDFSITAADARIILRVAAKLESIEIYK